MIRPHFASAISLAAMLAAAPAFAATTSPGTTPSAETPSKPLCSSFKNPNAGKLADKPTGEAKEHSASPVHMDCIPDSASGPSANSGPTPSEASNYGGLRDTTSNAQSTMPSTASSDSSGVYSNPTPEASSSGTRTATPKMPGSATRQ